MHVVGKHAAPDHAAVTSVPTALLAFRDHHLVGYISERERKQVDEVQLLGWCVLSERAIL